MVTSPYSSFNKRSRRFLTAAGLMLLGLLFLSIPASAQNPLLPAENKACPALIEQLKRDDLTASATISKIQSFQQYPRLAATGADYKWIYHDPEYGDIGFQVFIPKNYQSSTPSPAILLMHGAVGLTNLKMIDSVDKWDDLQTFAYLKDEGYIIIRPIADKKNKVDWAAKPNGTDYNHTFTLVCKALAILKTILNIDDNRVFAFGHSDGSDGATGLAVYSPDQFAAIIAYNSMLNNLFTTDFYIRNIANKPFYEVHSDLDNLRPIQKTRTVINGIKDVDDTVHYREYAGYQHEDKHLQLDKSNALAFMQHLSRNNSPGHIYWETGSAEYGRSSWLQIDQIDTNMRASWYKPFNFAQTFQSQSRTFTIDYYHGLLPGGVAKGTYHDNTFDLQTSGVRQLHIRISPAMVDLTKPITIIINGRQLFKDKVTMDKNYLISNFEKAADRKQLWVNAIKIEVPAGDKK